MKRVYEIPELKIERFDMEGDVCSPVTPSLIIYGGPENNEDYIKNRNLQNLYDSERVLK